MPGRPDSCTEEVLDGHIVLGSVLPVYGRPVAPSLLRERGYLGAFWEGRMLLRDITAEETHALRHTALFLISPHLGFEVNVVSVRQVSCLEIDVFVYIRAGDMLLVISYQHFIMLVIASIRDK
jgi:hypothetical protein